MGCINLDKKKEKIMFRMIDGDNMSRQLNIVRIFL